MHVWAGADLFSRAREEDEGPSVDLGMREAGNAMHCSRARHGEEDCRTACQKARGGTSIAGRLLVSEPNVSDANCLHEHSAECLQVLYCKTRSQQGLTELDHPLQMRIM